MKTKIRFIPLVYIFLIMVYSLMNNYNARFINDSYNSYFYKQLIFFVFGIILMVIIYKVRTSKIFKFHYFYYIVSLILLILVLIFGKEVNGAKAWFDFKFVSFQPSELMKLTLAITLTKLTYDFNKSVSKNEIFYIMKITLLTLIPSVLVFVEPDTGAIIFFLLIYLTAFMNSKVSKRWKILFFVILFSLLSFVIFIYFLDTDLIINTLGTSVFYRIDRLINFTDNYQINNAMTLMGSTSFFGNNSSELLINLPEAPTDFMYAYNFYNYGLFGCFLVTSLYFILCITVLIQSKSYLFKKMFISVLFFGVIYNILMNVGLVPIMGIVLPFLSYGGSSLIIYFMFLGIYFKDI